MKTDVLRRVIVPQRVCNSDPNWTLSADALSLVLVFGIFLWVALVVSLNGAVRDFSVLYTSGGMILSGQRSRLFDIVAQAEYQNRVLGMPAPLPFIHLAFESVLFVPLAMFSFKAALWIWRVISVCMLMLSGRLLADIFRGSNSQIVLLSLALFPVAVTIIQGQDSILLLLLFSLSMRALERSRDRSAGAWLALGLFRPHLILPVAVILVSVALTGIGGWWQMISLMKYAAFGTGNQIGGFATLRPNIRGFLALIGLAPNTAVVLNVLLAVALMIVVMWQLRRAYSPQELFAPAIVVALLISIEVRTHDLTILLVPILALLTQRRRPAAICATICFCFPVFEILQIPALFLFVISAVLLLTMSAPPIPNSLHVGSAT